MKLNGDTLGLPPGYLIKGVGRGKVQRKRRKGGGGRRRGKGRMMLI